MIMFLLCIAYSISNFTTPIISFLNIKKNNTVFKTDDLFWYLKFFTSSKVSQYTGKKIQIAIIDGKLNENNSIGKKIGIALEKTTQGDTKDLFDVIHQDNKKRSLCSTQKKINLQEIVKKYHADITINLILQIAPQVHITSISILNTQGGGSKFNFYQGLQKALKINPDILHLGVQVVDFDSNFLLDKKILKILKKFKCVIASAGNYGHLDVPVGFPANCPFVISVGSFGQRNNQYPISDFCQMKGGVDFVMPGENLLATIWTDEQQGYKAIPVSGTSMATALMTGFVALILEKYRFTSSLDLKKYLIQNSIILNKSWTPHVKYGFPV